MTENQTQYTFDRVVRILLTLAMLVGVFALLRYLSDVLLPFVAAVVLAYLLNPMVTFVERKTHRRGLSVFLTIGGLAVVGLTLIFLVVPLMIVQVGRFQNNFEKLRQDMAFSFDTGAEDEDSFLSLEVQEEIDSTTDVERSEWGWYELKTGWQKYRDDAERLSRKERFHNLKEATEGTYIGDFLQDAVHYTQSDAFKSLLVDAARKLAIGGWGVVAFSAKLLLFLTGMIFVLLVLVFLLLDYPHYEKTWQTFLPPAYRVSIVEFLEQFNLALRQYFRGQSIVALIVGTLFALGFTIIGLPMAVPFGLFVGLLNMVPYLQTVGLVPGMLLAALRAVEGDSSFAASVLLTLSVFVIVQILQDTLITPRIMGKATGLRPVAILLGMFVWSKLLGFMGLLLAIPFTCLGIAYYRRYILHHTTKDSYSISSVK